MHTPHKDLEARTFECELKGYAIKGYAYPIKHSQFHDYGVEVSIGEDDFTFKMIMTRIEPKKYNANLVTHKRTLHKRFFRFHNPLPLEECFEQTLIICIEELEVVRRLPNGVLPYGELGKL
jgi:hypothetical protein